MLKQEPGKCSSLQIGGVSLCAPSRCVQQGQGAPDWDLRASKLFVSQNDEPNCCAQGLQTETAIFIAACRDGLAQAPWIKAAELFLATSAATGPKTFRQQDWGPVFVAEEARTALVPKR